MAQQPLRPSGNPDPSKPNTLPTDELSVPKNTPDVDISLQEKFKIAPVRFARTPEKTKVPVTDIPPLGVLSKFVGNFAGTGFNLIFRPNSGPPTTTTFPNPVPGNPIPQPPNESVLELNLTTELLSFTNSLGSVPNRGLISQNDIFLNGVPYVQAINDVTNPATGKADGTPTAIHFEPGLFMHVPSTTVPPLAPTITRMGSIPHGTTINAQGLAPTASFPGGPKFEKIDITPFVINSNPPTKIRFAAQTATDVNTPRIPQTLTNFLTQGTITQAILDDPTEVLKKANGGKKFISTEVFTVATAHKDPPVKDLGGGVANIAFLEGNADATAPNANATFMTATFWVSTIEDKFQIPRFKPEFPKPGEPAQKPLLIRTAANPQGVTVRPPIEIKEPRTITVQYTQIQYAQVVNLDFAGLTWPHCSVATLLPAHELTLPDSVWK